MAKTRKPASDEPIYIIIFSDGSQQQIHTGRGDTLPAELEGYEGRWMGEVNWIKVSIIVLISILVIRLVSWIFGRDGIFATAGGYIATAGEWVYDSAGDLWTYSQPALEAGWEATKEVGSASLEMIEDGAEYIYDSGSDLYDYIFGDEE